MSARDGFLFGLGRIGAEVALFLALVVTLALVFALAHHAPRLWWRLRGTRCGATGLWSQRGKGPCVLHKGHAGHHADAWQGREGEERSRMRWQEFAHGSVSYREWDSPWDTPDSEDADDA